VASRGERREEEVAELGRRRREREATTTKKKEEEEETTTFLEFLSFYSFLLLFFVGAPRTRWKDRSLNTHKLMKPTADRNRSFCSFYLSIFVFLLSLNVAEDDGGDKGARRQAHTNDFSCRIRPISS